MYVPIEVVETLVRLINSCNYYGGGSIFQGMRDRLVDTGCIKRVDDRYEVVRND